MRCGWAICGPSLSVQVRSDLAFGLGQGALVGLTLLMAVYGPRSGQPAALIPLGAQELNRAFAFAEAERAPLMQVDTNTGRLIIIAPSSGSLLRAVMNGFLPISAGPVGCADIENRSQA